MRFDEATDERSPSAADVEDSLSSPGMNLTGMKINFPIDAFSKACLLNGVDELGYILGFEKEIAGFEAKHSWPGN